MSKKCRLCGREIDEKYDLCYVCNSNKLVKEAVSGGHIEPSSSGHSLLTHCPDCGRKLIRVPDDDGGILGLLCLPCGTMRIPVKMIA